MVILYAIISIVGLLILWRVGLTMWQKTLDTYHYAKNLELDRQSRTQMLREPTRITPDPMSGSYPLLQEPGGGRILDPDRGLVFDWSGLQNASPEVHRWAALRRLWQSVRAPIGNETAAQMLEAPVATEWPEMVDLRGLFVNRQPTIEDLVVGIYYDNGHQKVLSASIHDLMHVLAVGASGWGKSSWLRSLLWQVAKAREPVDVVAIDVSGSEFNTLHGWGKLRYPVAREPEEAAALLDEVTQEVTRRKELYEAYPMASNLPEYNRLADEDLEVWLVLVDEGTALLNQGDIGKYLRRGVQTARQYGCYFVVTGQSASHRVIETQTRDQFSTRLCFRTSPTSSRVVLDDGAASGINAKGRAFAQLVGHELCEILGPYITKEELAKTLTNHGPKFPMPVIQANGNGNRAVRIKDLAAQGWSQRRIQHEVFGYTGGAAYEEVARILAATTDTDS